MEKLKWVFLGVLLVVLIVTIIVTNYQPSTSAEKPVFNNYAIIYLTFDGQQEQKTLKFLPGKYVLSLDRMEIFQSPYSGWHLNFVDSINQTQRRVFICDIVETTGQLSDINSRICFAKFIDKQVPLLPVSLQKMFNCDTFHLQFYRGFFQYGFIEQEKNYIREETIHFYNFFCYIDTLWYNDGYAGMKMAFVATPVELISMVYKGNYILSGFIHIGQSSVVQRLIQKK